MERRSAVPRPIDDVGLVAGLDVVVRPARVAIDAHVVGPLSAAAMHEDNGIGISVRTPPDWISSVYSTQLPYFFADGSDILSVLATATEAVDWVRANRAPAT